jgi:hypothetical protein
MSAQALTVIPPPVPAFSMGDIRGIAEAIAKGGMFGSKDPYAVLTLCLLAQAEGQHPAIVFRDYHIIQGKPAKKADAMLRDFLSGGGKVEWHTLTNECADATFSHPAGGSARIDWTMARAKTAGLATAMWSKFPRQMLRSRVISEGVRTIYPGATSGLYVPEEVSEFEQRGDTPAERMEAPANETPTMEMREEAQAAPARQRPAPLTGKHKTRAAARVAYGEIVRELNACEDDETLSAYLETIAEDIEQFQTELPAAWEGDGADFIGLRAEIEAAQVRCMDSNGGEALVDLMRAG